MGEFFEKFTKFMTDFQVIIWPSLVAIYIAGSKMYKTWKLKKVELDDEISKKDHQRRIKEFKDWEHVQSGDIIVRTRNMCNMYKDKSGADRILYLQLENGTLATSQLCNMFMSALAADSRYSDLSKDISKLQRIPYTMICDWVEHIKSTTGIGKEINYMSLSGDNELLKVTNALNTDPAGSQLSTIVYDQNHTFIGVCVFEYARPEFNGLAESIQVDLLKEMKVSVGAILVNYAYLREKKKDELRIHDIE